MYGRLRGCWCKGWNGVAEEGKERTKRERLGSVCGVGVSVWVPQQPPLCPNTLSRPPPHHHRFAAAAAATIPHTRRGGRVRREGWSWINTTAGRGGARATMARAYAASSRGGFKDKDSLRQFIPATLSTTLKIFFFLDYIIIINIGIKIKSII